MKKDYINPEMTVVVMTVNQQLLAGSPDAGGQYGGTEVLSSEFQDNGVSEDW